MLEYIKNRAKQLAEQIRNLSDDDRLRILELLPFCRLCGSDETEHVPCRCWNDE